jgi:cytosine/adenosine deaminase-related metal-dependent hydrolase
MIYKNAIIITMNPERHIVTHGAVVVDGGKFVAVGKTSDMIVQYPSKQQIDCNGNILLPGLFATHLHMAQGMLRGVSEGKQLAPLSSWLTKRIWPLQGSYTEEDARASAALCVLEMLKSGTVGFVECLLAGTYGFDGIADLILQSGIRAALGRVVMDVSPDVRERIGMHPGMWESLQQCIEGALDAHKKWEGAGDGRLQVWFGCRTIEEINNPTMFDEVGRLAREHDMGITIHHSEMPGDTAYVRSLGYRTPTEFALDKGLLGPRTVLAHFIESDEEDWKKVAASGASVSHNPANNSSAGWGPAPVVGMMDSGVNVSIGCDGAPSNANMDLLRDLRITSHVARVKDHTRMVMPSETVLEMATLNGARAMGILETTGSIEVGKQADFIIINTDVPHLQPVWNPVAAVVFGAQGSDVDTVVIDGKTIMQNRKVLTLDEETIVDDVRQRYLKVAERAGIEKIVPNWPII